MSYEEDRAFQQAVSEGLVPKMENSNFAVAVCPTEGPHKVDAKFAVELGVMIMLDKPIIAVVKPGTPIPKKLALVADKVLQVDLSDPRAAELIKTAVTELQEKGLG